MRREAILLKHILPLKVIFSKIMLTPAIRRPSTPPIALVRECQSHSPTTLVAQVRSIILHLVLSLQVLRTLLLSQIVKAPI